MVGLSYAITCTWLTVRLRTLCIYHSPLHTSPVVRVSEVATLHSCTVFPWPGLCCAIAGPLLAVRHHFSPHVSSRLLGTSVCTELITTHKDWSCHLARDICDTRFPLLPHTPFLPPPFQIWFLALPLLTCVLWIMERAGMIIHKHSYSRLSVLNLSRYTGASIHS